MQPISKVQTWNSIPMNGSKVYCYFISVRVNPTVTWKDESWKPSAQNYPSVNYDVLFSLPHIGRRACLSLLCGAGCKWLCAFAFLQTRIVAGTRPLLEGTQRKCQLEIGQGSFLRKIWIGAIKIKVTRFHIITAVGQMLPLLKSYILLTSHISNFL